MCLTKTFLFAKLRLESSIRATTPEQRHLALFHCVSHSRRNDPPGTRQPRHALMIRCCTTAQPSLFLLTFAPEVECSRSSPLLLTTSSSASEAVRPESPASSIGPLQVSPVVYTDGRITEPPRQVWVGADVPWRVKGACITCGLVACLTRSGHHDHWGSGHPPTSESDSVPGVQD